VLDRIYQACIGREEPLVKEFCLSFGFGYWVDITVLHSQEEVSASPFIQYIWVIYQMSLASSLLYRWSCAHFFFAFIRAMQRALVASYLSILSRALQARTCACMHFSDHHVAPFASEICFGLRVFLHTSLIALSNSFMSLLRYS
jgi:hypothetical protein